LLTEANSGASFEQYFRWASVDEMGRVKKALLAVDLGDIAQLYEQAFQVALAQMQRFGLWAHLARSRRHPSSCRCGALRRHRARCRVSQVAPSSMAVLPDAAATASLLSHRGSPCTEPSQSHA
jgi:hypothetical protein